jgi:hypothetical protein
MDRRTVLALVLVAAVILLTPKIFPPAPRIPPPPTTPGAAESVSTPAVTPQQPAVTPTTSSAPVPAQDSVTRLPVETLNVTDSISTFTFVNTGGALLQVVQRQYRALGGTIGQVVLEGRGVPLVRFSGISGRDTIPFDETAFRVTRRDTIGTTARISFEGVVASDTLILDYEVKPDSFVARVDGRVRGPLATNGFVLMQYAPTHVSYEADSSDDQRHLGFA